MQEPDRPYRTDHSWAAAMAAAIPGLCAVALGSAFLYASLHHNYYTDAPRAMRVGLYGIAPILAVSLGLGIWKNTIEGRLHLTLLVTSSVIALYLAESALVVLPAFGAERTIGSIAGDVRTKRQVVADLRDQGILAVPDLRPEVLMRSGANGRVQSILKIGQDEVLPLGGISNTTTVLCNETGFWVVYDSDRHGFNNPDSVWMPRPLEVAIVGDSFAHGYCVLPEHQAASLIRKRFAATVNLGMAGNGPLLMLAAIVEYLPSLKPRHVVWFYYEGNDMSNLEREKRSQLLMRYLSSGFSQRLVDRQESIDSMLRNWLERRVSAPAADDDIRDSNRGLMRFLKLTSSRRVLNLSYDYRLWGDLALFRQILMRARDTVGAWGATLHFVYLPSRYQELMFNDATAVQREIMAIAQDLGLPVIDIRRVFSARPNPRSLLLVESLDGRDRMELPGHYSVEGNRLLAEAVLETLPSAPK